MDPQAQAAHAVPLLALLHEQPHSRALIEITGLMPRQRPVKDYYTYREPAIGRALELNALGYSVFVNVNARNAMTGFEYNVDAVTSMALDLQPERTNIETVGNVLTAIGIPPTVVAGSGHGAHMYLRLSEPAEPQAAKLVWERLCVFTGSDRIFNTNRIMRLPGSVNWKTPPAWCYLVSIAPERRYTVEYINACLDKGGAGPARKPVDGIQVPTVPPVDWFEVRGRLDAGTLDIIDTGEKNAYSEKQVTKSEADWVVVCALVRAGVPDDMIHWIYEKQPVGNMKYRAAGPRYLNKTIESARRATAEKPEYTPPHSPGRPRRYRGSSSESGPIIRR